MTSQKDSPAWFRRNMEMPRDARFVNVDGCAIHYLRWGDRQKPGLVFLAGSGGHAHWFSAVAPFFADAFNVVAMDPAGNGDSGRRPQYSLELLISEIFGVCADAGMFEAAIAPVIAGHSMGGQFAVRAAIARGEQLLGVIAIDALRQALLEKDPAVAHFAAASHMEPPRPQRAHPSFEAAVSRFRLQPEPEHEITEAYILDHIARNSVQKTADGWTWKYDANFRTVGGLGLELKNALKSLPCRAAVIFGEDSHIVDEQTLARMDEATGGHVPSFIIPGTTHYPMIDSPFAFVAAMRGVLSVWVADARKKQT